MFYKTSKAWTGGRRFRLVAAVLRPPNVFEYLSRFRERQRSWGDKFPFAEIQRGQFLMGLGAGA